MDYIMAKYPVSDEEYEELEKKFDRLCCYVAWQFRKRNVQNMFSRDQCGEDEIQNVRIALLRAACYYKRQLYILACFQVLNEHIKDKPGRMVLEELQILWRNRKKRGAKKQQFGEYQEIILDKLVQYYVPPHKRPPKNPRLVIDKVFSTYAKQIMWNEMRAMGKKMTKEKQHTGGLISLSKFEQIYPPRTAIKK